jgi:hypothetical protein
MSTEAKTSRPSERLLRLLEVERVAIRALDLEALEGITLEKEPLVRALEEDISLSASGFGDTSEIERLGRLRFEVELNAILFAETLRAMRQHFGVTDAGVYDRSARRPEFRARVSKRSA